MSAIALLMGLLLLSYVGSLIVGGRSARGLPSGVEFLALGLAVGPHALALVERSMIADFRPIVQVALAWLAFMVGLDFGRVEGRRVRVRAMVLGVLGALLTGGTVGYAVLRMLDAVPVDGLGGNARWVLAAGAGAVTAETTRFGVQWVAARWNVRGPLSALLVEIAASDDLVPIVVVGAIFAFFPDAGIAVHLPAAAWFGVSVALGAVLGTVTALLLRGAEGYAVWSALIGTLLLGVGIAERFGLASIFVTFVMGIALAALSPARRVLRRMVGATERAVLFPMLLLAGARIDARPILENRKLLAIIALVLLARIVGKLASGWLFQLGTTTARRAGPLLGMVLLSSGPFSISCGLVLAFHFPGPVGDTLLVCAMASAVLGELVSTLALKQLFAAVGEIREPRTPITTPRPAPADPSTSEASS